MTKIEEVARAIALRNTGAEGAWKSFVGTAIDAVRAMREPNEAMVDAAPEEGVGYNKDSRGYAANYFQAMIDAAIAEHEG